MARQAVAMKNNEQTMRDEAVKMKTKRLKPPSAGTSRQHVVSQDSLSDPESRSNKATMKDIDELYKALQGLVPKPTPSRKRRGNGTDSDTSGTEVSGLRRKYHSEKHSNKDSRKREDSTKKNNIAQADLDVTPKATTHRHVSREQSESNRITNDRRAMSEDCLFVSDDTAEEPEGRLQRVRSLPAYPTDENESEEKTTESKKSRFPLFRRRQRHKRPHGTKSKTKKLSWRTLFTSFSIRSHSEAKKPKKKGSKNKVASDDVAGGTKVNNEGTQMQPRSSSEKGNNATVSKHTPTVRRAVTDVGGAGRSSPLITNIITPVVRRSVRETNTPGQTRIQKKLMINGDETTRLGKSPETVQANEQPSRIQKLQHPATQTVVETARVDHISPHQTVQLHHHPTTPLNRRVTMPAVRTPGVEKRRAPEPPVDNPQPAMSQQLLPLRGRCNTIETKTNEVHKKLSTWYQNAVKETSSPAPVVRIRRNKSCESLLTDSEILKSRKAPNNSSDTDSVGESLANLRKVRVRKTRAKRNRQKERARWQSLPNVKLVSVAVAKHQNKAEHLNSTKAETVEEIDETCEPAAADALPTTEQPAEIPEVEPDTAVPAKHATSVCPLQAKISLGNSGGEEGESPSEEPVTDFMSIQTDSNTIKSSNAWVSRQCSKTSTSCIRPLKLSLFYSESPSRETVHRSQSFQVPNKLWFTGNPDIAVADDSPIKMRRNNSDRRRRRRNQVKRQSRLPQQSLFYSPTAVEAGVSPTPPSLQVVGQALSSPTEVKSMDSGLGSPDNFEEKVFGMSLAGKRKHSDELGRVACESEDSGWASRENYHHVTSNQVEHGVQTEPMSTDITIIPRTRLSHDTTESHRSDI